MGQQAERDMPMPAVPAPHLILIQPNFPFGPIEAFLDHPARPGDRCHDLERRGLRSEDPIDGVQA